MDSDQNNNPTNWSGKPSNGKSNFWNRFTAILHGRDEVHRYQPANVIEALSLAITALAETVRILCHASDKSKATHESPTTPIEIVRWPPAFARVLIDGGVKCDDTRREAARRYDEVLDDLQQHQSELAKASGDQMKPWQDSVTRWKRQLTYQQNTLRNLGVTVNADLIGSLFDPSLHEPVETAATQTESAANTIAAVKCPMFSWKDENGTPQCVPAKVVLYTLDKS